MYIKLYIKIYFKSGLDQDATIRPTCGSLFIISDSLVPFPIGLTISESLELEFAEFVEFVEFFSSKHIFFIKY